MTSDAGRMLCMNRSCTGQRGHDAPLRRCALSMIVGAARCAVSTRLRACTCTGKSDVAACSACAIMQDGYWGLGCRHPRVHTAPTTVRFDLAIDMPRLVWLRGAAPELAWRRGFSQGSADQLVPRLGEGWPAFCAALGRARTVQVRRARVSVMTAQADRDQCLGVRQIARAAAGEQAGSDQIEHRLRDRALAVEHVAHDADACLAVSVVGDQER